MTKEDITPELKSYLYKNWPLPDPMNENYTPRMNIRKGFILGSIWQKQKDKPKNMPLMSDDDEWYFGNLFAHLDAQRNLVLAGKQDKINREQIANFCNKYK